MAEAAPAPPAPRRPSARRLAKPALGAVLAAVIVLWALTAAGMGGAPRNSAYDEGARGVSILAQGLQVQGIGVQSLGTGPHAIDAAEEPGRSVLLVAGVERAYSEGEVQAIQGFVARGGTVLVADDFGFGDQVGAAFGVTFDKRQLRDANYDRNVSLVRVNATLGAENFTFTMNVPASLGSAPGANVTPLAVSGSDSYIDENLDGQEDTGDIKGPFLVLGAVRSGPGQALFASDPGMLANDLAPDNGPFVQALFKSLLPDGGTVFVDESRHGQEAGAPLAALLAGEVQLTSELGISIAAVLAAALLAAAAFAVSPRTEDISAHASTLDLPAHLDSPERTGQRLRRLARRVAEQRSGWAPEQVEQATPQQLAVHVPDPAVKALLLGESTKAEALELLRKVQLLARKGSGGAR
ncbi:MAG: DUF4350 domain-containing protein [Halobacteriales archaeon]|nr:DUF4350 domain-containing protein [Halobacteriales archaeon]